MTNYYKDKIVVGIVKNKLGKVLLAKVRDSKLGEFGNIQYVFPGGRVEGDETPEDALEREILEETGYQVDVVGQVSFRVHPVTNEEIYYYHCKTNTNILKTGTSDEDIDHVLWVDLNKLGDYMTNINPDIERAIAIL